jgi:uncharacterized protein (UPF0548 family)
LTGHPERGEEAFHVERSTDGEVTFGVVAFSRPADYSGESATRSLAPCRTE